MNEITYVVTMQKLNKYGEPIKNAHRYMCDKFKESDPILAMHQFMNKCKQNGRKEYRYELSEALRWKHVMFYQWDEKEQRWKEIRV